MPTSEANVIGAVCKNKDVSLILGEDKTLFGDFEDVFEFIKDHYLRHKVTPEKQLLNERFGDLGIPDTTAPTAYYLDELKNVYVRNQMEQLMYKAGEQLEKKPSARILERLSTELASLYKFSNTARDIDITDVEWATDHLKRLKDRADANDGTPGMSTGFKAIDSAYPKGITGGDSIIGMGYTGRGKSMFADLLAVKIHDQGYKPMIISLEMSPEEQMERIYAMMSLGQFKISELSRGDIQMDDFDVFSRKKLDKAAPFVVVSSEGISEITPNVVQAKFDTHRPDFIILDYLQLMKDNAKTQAMTPRMLNLSSEIKRLAMANNVPILSLTAVTDEDGDKRDAPPVLSQISWSSGIEYDANLVFAIHRYDGTNMVEVVCRKNRHGDMFDFFFEVDFDAGVWTEKYDFQKG